MTDRIPAGSARSLVALAVALALSLAVSAIGGAATATSVGEWYGALSKPSFTPPREAFPIVWPILYAMIAIAAWLVWRQPVSGSRRNALVLYAVQLTLNLAWSLAFFGARSPTFGLLVIGALIVAIVSTIAAFRRVDPLAALLMVPYLAWVGFASALNGAIVAMN